MAERQRRSEHGARPYSARGRAAAAWGRAAVTAPAGQPPVRRAGTSTAPAPEPVPGRSGHLGIGLAAAAMLGGLALLLHSHGLQVSGLDITGLRQMTAAEVEADLQLSPGTYVWQVRPWVIDRRLRLDPLVAAAHTSVVWPDALRVAIVERVPVALVQDGQTAWEVDSAGRLLRALPVPVGLRPATVAGLGSPLPVVTGLQLPNAQAGQIVSSAGLQQALAVAASIGGALGTQINGVTVAADGQVGVVTAGGMPVNYGDGTQASRKTDTLLGILALAQAQGVRLASCDVSAPATPACQVQQGSPALVYQPPSAPASG